MILLCLCRSRACSRKTIQLNSYVWRWRWFSSCRFRTVTRIECNLRGLLSFSLSRFCLSHQYAYKKKNKSNRRRRIWDDENLGFECIVVILCIVSDQIQFWLASSDERKERRWRVDCVKNSAYSAMWQWVKGKWQTHANAIHMLDERGF